MTTTSIAPPGLVQGVAREALPFGLLSVVAFRTDGRWESGVIWETSTCEDADGIADFQCEPPTLGLPKNLDRLDAPLGEASPFTVYGHHNCSPVGITPAGAQAKADEHLAVKGPKRVEQAFWTGDLGNVPNLKDSATTLASGAALSPTAAIAELEAHVAGTYGGRGVIHVSVAGAVHLVSAGLVKVDGGSLSTALGTPVVAGAGYSADGPSAAADGQFWAYVTPPVFGYRSPVNTSSNREGDLLDRGSNDLYAIAEQTYLLGFDPCGVGAVLIDPAS